MNAYVRGSARRWVSILPVAMILAVFAADATAGKGSGKGGGGGDNGNAWGRTPGWGGGKNKCDPSPAAPAIDGLPTFSVIEGMNYTFKPSATDPNCDQLNFLIAGKPDWASFDSGSGTLGGRPPVGSAGTYPGVVISVSDGTYTTSLPEFSIEVYANSTPLIYGTPPGTVISDTEYRFQPEASDPDGQTLTFSIAGKPAWASFSTTTGQMSGLPSRDQKGTYGGIVISVSDGLDSASLPEFSVTVEATNTAPSIAGSPSTSVDEGRSYAFTPSASDAEGDPITFSVQNRPAWASFSASSGRLSGTPSRTDAGTYPNIVITASDGSLSSSLAAFSIEVRNVNGVPTIQGTPPGSVIVGQSYSFTPTASDPDGDPLTFSIANAPRWVAFNTSTGRLSGTPDSSQIGEYIDISLAVSDGEAQSTLGPFSISVNEIVNGSATLSWQPPTQRTDGSSLSNLAGYRILFGQAPGSYTDEVRLDNPGLTSYVVENLAEGTWYFVMTAFDSTGTESNATNAVSKTITAP